MSEVTISPTFATRLGRWCMALFAVSVTFPVVASFCPVDAPRWAGIADVAVAAVLLTASIALAKQIDKQLVDADKLSAFRASQLAISIIPVLLILFFLVGNRVKWDVLVIGLAWRAWLFLYSLPYLIAARRISSQHS